jgi:hypothetical protein
MANTTYVIKRAKKQGDRTYYQEVGELLIREGGKNGILFLHSSTASSRCSPRSRRRPRRTAASSAGDRGGLRAASAGCQPLTALPWGSLCALWSRQPFRATHTNTGTHCHPQPTVTDPIRASAAGTAARTKVLPLADIAAELLRSCV